MNTTNTKSIFLSKTFLGALLTVVSTISGLGSFDVETGNLTLNVWQLAGIFTGSSFAVYGRLVAKQLTRIF